MRLGVVTLLCVSGVAVTPAWAASSLHPDPNSLSEPLLRYVVLLSVATIMVLLVRRLKLPNLIGEISASFLLGASVLGVIAPSWFGWLTVSTPTTSKVLEFIGLLGILFLLLKTGFEVDIDEFKNGRRVRQALVIGALAFAIPFSAVLLIAGPLLSISPIGGEVPIWKVAICLAATTSMPAMVVIAKLLDDLKLSGTGPSVIILSSYLVLDLIAFMGFSVARGVTSEGVRGPEYFFLLALGCVSGVILALTIGRWCFDRLAHFASQRGSGDGFWIIATAIAITAVSLGALTDHFGLTKIPGFFLAGMMAGGLEESMKKRVSEFGCFVFTPVYFAMVGLQINLWSGVNWGWVLVMALLPLGGKILGGYVGARASGIRQVYVPVVAVACGAMGAVEIVAAKAFLEDKLFSQQLFNSVVVAVVLSLLVVPKLLAHCIKLWEEVDITTLIKSEHVKIALEADTLTEAFEVIGKWVSQAKLCPEAESGNGQAGAERSVGRLLLQQCVENNGLVGSGVALSYVRMGSPQVPMLIVVRVQDPLTLLSSTPVPRADPTPPTASTRTRRRRVSPSNTVDVPMQLPDDGKPIRWIFCAFVKKRDSGGAVRILRQVLSIVRSDKFVAELGHAHSAEEVAERLLAIDQAVNS